MVAEVPASALEAFAVRRSQRFRVWGLGSLGFGLFRVYGVGVLGLEFRGLGFRVI